VFGEPFPAVRAWGFAMIWLALAIYVGDGFLKRGRYPFPPNETRAAADTSPGQ
jgi:hypothetical protein